MAHQRTTIRNALVALLSGTDKTDAQTRVYPNRKTNLATSQLPAIQIFDEQESATARDLRSTQYIRTLETKIEIFVEGNTDYDEDLDDICKQVEDLISADRTITGTASSVLYSGTELVFDGSGEKLIAKATLSYEIKYLA